MDISNTVPNATKTIKANAPEILAGAAIAGVISTAYLAGKASYEASKIIKKHEKKNPPSAYRKERVLERAKLTWKLYIPAGLVGAVTIGAIVGSTKASSRRTAAAVTAYSLTERAFSEYKEKVVEELGKGKDRKIRDQIAQDRVNENPPPTEVVVLANGHVMCCELYTHRYFRSDMETLRKAQNDINARVISQLYVTLDEFYDILGLDHTTASNNKGWNSDRMMELVFTTVLAPNGDPCLAFEYNYVKPLD